MKNIDNRNFKRAGSAPKTICYSNNNIKRQFEYQNEVNNRIGIEMASKKGRNQNPKINAFSQSKDENDGFRKVKVFHLADSKRCFIPELNTEPDKISRRLLENKLLSRNEYQYHPGNLISVISRTENMIKITDCQKKTNPRNYRSVVFATEPSQSIEEIPKSSLKVSQFNCYKSTTQIETLPGGIKRSSSANPKGRPEISFNKKLMNDYKSKITCLPGTVIKAEAPEPYHKKMVFESKNRNNQSNVLPIQLTNHPQSSKATLTPHTLFNVSNKRQYLDQKVFGESSKEIHFISQARSKRPMNIKNPFESQISIS